jgi:hypothetical protein
VRQVSRVTGTQHAFEPQSGSAQDDILRTYRGMLQG